MVVWDTNVFGAVVTVSLGLVSVSPEGDVIVDNVAPTLNGIPAVQTSPDLGPPIAASLTYDAGVAKLALTFADEPEAGAVIVYPPYDPAVRTSGGGYVAPTALPLTIV